MSQTAVNFEQVALSINDQESRLQRIETTDFLRPDTITPFLELPGLRGFWATSAYDDVGNLADLAGFDAAVTELALQGNPVYNYTSRGVSYCRLDGTGDYFSHADSAHYDILGTEAFSGVPGLTLGCWTYVENAANTQNLIAKWAPPANRAYRLYADGAVANDPVIFAMSDDGINADNVQLVGYSVNTWHFVAARFDDAQTGAELKIWLDNASNTAATARNAIFNGNANFTVGASSAGAQLLTGRISRAFLCAMSVSDNQIESIFHRTRGAYGV